MKRILFPYVGDSVGGSHISSLTLAQGLPDTRYEPVIAQHQSGPLSRYLQERGISPVEAPDVAFLNSGSFRKQFLKAWVGVPKLVRFLRAQQIDIVHTHDIRMHIIWGMAAKRAGLPHIWHQRTPTTAKRLDKYSAHAEQILAVSAYCRAQFPPAMRERASVLFNPFEIPEPANRAAAKAALLGRLGLSADKRVIGFIANLDTRKRPLLFVEIAKALVATGRQDLHFIMLGEARAPHIGELEGAIQSAGLERVVQHIGPQYPIAPWMAGLDLLIAPAVHEALGRTMIEAQLFATPVVASDAGGNPEIILDEKTGLLATPDDPQSFSSAAIRLLEDASLAQTLTAAGKVRAEQTFSATRHITAMLEIYDRLA
ncbi:glycosyltransferase family 4 protein [Donghicola sp. C2-DW-16]|uniref:Glycosyltransferase family 4 protein n=1 Tax=Donghicola mangrovi TaxID=2729614 RepID=A0ABX2PD37_9RHOB|nr:glycosyltransferase family 4 protein [Donghicola mangrovi]NVO26954.1 glycosyltransferase family 4 protein [Donghicola mangrovi]